MAITMNENNNAFAIALCNILIEADKKFESKQSLIGCVVLGFRQLNSIYPVDVVSKMAEKIASDINMLYSQFMTADKSEQQRYILAYICDHLISDTYSCADEDLTGCILSNSRFIVGGVVIEVLVAEVAPKLNSKAVSDVVIADFCYAGESRPFNSKTQGVEYNLESIMKKIAIKLHSKHSPTYA